MSIKEYLTQMQEAIAEEADGAAEYVPSMIYRRLWIAMIAYMNTKLIEQELREL